MKRVASAAALVVLAWASTAHAVQGGVPDTTSAFAVGVIGDDLHPCTGVLVTPNVVITARRCVQPSPSVLDCAQNPQFSGSPRTMEVITDASMVNADRRAVKSIIVPSTMNVCGNDIALLVLTDLVPSATATPIAPAVNEAPNHPKYSRKLTAIGYGLTSPSTPFDGTRRRVEEMSIACVPGDASFPCPAGFDANELAGGDGLCDYDWGLAAVEQTSFTNGAPVALGVLSRTGKSADETSCQGSIFTRLDLHRDLVVSTAESASDNWALYPKPSWADPPPPPDAGPEEPDAGDGGGGPVTIPAPGGGKTSPDGGASEENAAAPPDDGGCRSAPKTGPRGSLSGVGLLAGAVAALAARARRRTRNAS